jgi:threonine aldolase
MNFTSDNCYGAWPEILAAVSRAAEGAARSYGDDEITARVKTCLSEIFEHEVVVHPVISGTAANALALATLVPPHGAVICHAESHIAVDECGAPEFFSHGAKLVGIEGRDAKLAPDAVEAALAHFQKGFVHHAQPLAISITQSTERGTVYRPDEVAALASLARRHGMKVHMDGARFANAVAHLKCRPAEITWRAGVDVLCFGATKGGAIGAEAVVFFNTADASDFEYRRKKGGHLMSKMRFVSAQLDAYLAEERWLRYAAEANARARRLADGLLAVNGAELAHPVETNAVFVRLPNAAIARLRDAGAAFYDWAPPGKDKTLIRLVTAFATPDADIERFIQVARA